jgi:DNA (cytosine-5)-methyltransferase 1
MLRAIKEVRPRWVVAENVPGIIRMELDTVLSDLENENYSTGAIVIPACAVQAPHRRDRVWIIASDALGKRCLDGSSDRDRRPILSDEDGNAEEDKSHRQRREYWIGASNENASNATKIRLQGSLQANNEKGSQSYDEFIDGRRREWDGDWYEVATSLCRVDDGVPKVLDRTPRIKALGNAIVPQVAYSILSKIRGVDG